jgi:hypothetical protein
MEKTDRIERVNIQGIVVPLSQYEGLIKENESLIKENKELREKIATLQNEICNLYTTITYKNIEIDELRRENEFLRSKIKELECKMDLLMVDNIELKKDNIELKRDNVRLNHKLDYVEFKHKLLISLQDLNERYKLEKSAPLNYKEIMLDLHGEWSHEYHYILDNDSANEEIYKQQVMLEQLQNLPDYIKTKFDKHYSDDFSIIDFFITEIKNNLTFTVDKSDIPAKTLRKINNFWNE